jgi:mycothiol synthase
MGFTSVRWFEELLRPLGDLPERRNVDGVRIVAWPDDRDDEIRGVKNIAFADHWGSTPTSEHHWQKMVRGFGGRPDLSLVALDAAGAVVAHCLCKRYPADDELLGRRDGWIDNLGTLPGWRGRGIASALVIDALHRFAADGLTHASIGVDADSPTGAAGLYRSLGFVPQQRSVTHEIVLGPSDAGVDVHHRLG